MLRLRAWVTYRYLPRPPPLPPPSETELEKVASTVCGRPVFGHRQRFSVFRGEAHAPRKLFFWKVYSWIIWPTAQTSFISRHGVCHFCAFRANCSTALCTISYLVRIFWLCVTSFSVHYCDSTPETLERRNLEVKHNRCCECVMHLMAHGATKASHEIQATVEKGTKDSLEASMALDFSINPKFHRFNYLKSDLVRYKRQRAINSILFIQ